MKIFDRATKTNGIRTLWGVLLVVFLLGLLWARSSQHGAMAEQVRAAEGRAIRYSDTTVSEQVIEHGDRITFAPRQQNAALDASVMTDATVASVRVWGTDGAILASTVPGEMPDARLDGEPMLTSAAGGATVSKVVNTSSGTHGRAEDMLEVFTPLHVGDRSGPVGVVEVDFLYHDVIAAAPSSSTWTRFFFLLAFASGTMLVLSLLRGRKDAAAPKLTRFTTDDPVPLQAVPDAASGGPEPPRADELREELAVTREQLRQAAEAVEFLESRVKEGPAPSALAADVEAAQARIAELEAELGHVRAEADQAKEHAASTEQELDRLRTETDQRVAVLQQRMREVSTGNGAPAGTPVMNGDGEQPVANGNGDRAATNGNGDRAVGAIEPVAVEPQPEPQPETARRPEPSAPAPQVEPMRGVPSLIAELEAQVAEAEDDVGALKAPAPEASGEGTSLNLSPEADALRARLARTAARKKRLGSERVDDEY